MPKEYPENIDNIEGFYRSNHPEIDNSPDEKIYHQIRERMAPLNRRAVRRRRKQRVLYISIAANVALLITITLFSIYRGPKAQDSAGTDSQDSTSTQIANPQEKKSPAPANE